MLKEKVSSLHQFGKLLKANYYYLWPIPIFLILLIQTIPMVNKLLLQNSTTSYAVSIFNEINLKIISLVPYSLTEILLITLTILIIILLVKNIKKIVKIKTIAKSNTLFTQKTRIKYYKTLLVLGLIYLLFIVVYGNNYNKEPLFKELSITTTSISESDLIKTTTWLVELANNLRETREEDSTGVFRLETSLASMLTTAENGYTYAAQYYPTINNEKRYPKPKIVLSSKYWSYTKTTGVYFPFLNEVSINTDIPAYQLPFTTLHELNHYKGYAKEEDANFLAFLVGLHHPSKDFNYSAVLVALNYMLQDVKKIDTLTYNEIISKISPKVARDILNSQEYWGDKTGVLSMLTKELNNSYLKLNKQPQGVRSYNKIVDLIILWHKDVIGSEEITKIHRSMG